MADIITLAQQFRAELLAQDAMALGEMTKRWLTVEQSLNGRVEALAVEIAAIQAEGGKVPRWKLYELQRYQSLLAQTAAEITTYNQWAEGKINQLQTDAILMADEHAKALLLETVGGEATAVATWDKLPVGAIQNITAIAQAGQPLNKVLQKSYPTAVEGLTNLLINNTAAGVNPRETARTAVRDGLSAGLNHILLVARDQQIRNYREATRQRYDESDVIYGYMRLAAKNTRTCVACLALDGSVWETSEVMPLHPQDRCSMVPLVEGYPVPDFKRGEEWFREQDGDVQRRMMGNGRYQAWQDGLFEFKQLGDIGRHPVWGPSLKETSLKALLKGQGGLNGSTKSVGDLLKKHQSKPAKPKKPALRGAGEGVL